MEVKSLLKNVQMLIMPSGSVREVNPLPDIPSPTIYFTATFDIVGGIFTSFGQSFHEISFSLYQLIPLLPGLNLKQLSGVEVVSCVCHFAYKVIGVMTGVSKV